MSIRVIEMVIALTATVCVFWANHHTRALLREAQARLAHAKALYEQQQRTARPSSH